MGEFFTMAVGIAIFGYVLNLRFKIRRGGIVIPPLVLGHLLFGVSYLLFLLSDLAAAHLIWFYPLSIIVGVLLSILPVCQYIVIVFLGCVSYPGRVDSGL